MSQPETNPSDAQLMAFADGELSQDDAAWVARRVDADADTARRLAVFTETRRRLTDAAREQGDIPDALMNRITGTIAAHEAAQTAANVVTLPQWRRSAPIWAVPLAASVALAVGLGIGLTTAPDTPQTPFEAFTSAAAQASLDAAATGETVQIASGELRILATFRTGANGLCREATLLAGSSDAAHAVLCRAADGTWVPELALRQPADPTGFATASGASVLDAFLTDIDAGAPLDPDAEARALAE